MAAMSRATRRIIVMHLMRNRMSIQEIASELGVSPDTVRRDAAAAEQDAPQDTQDAQHLRRLDPVPVAPQVGAARTLAHDGQDAAMGTRPARPEASGLLLPESEQMGQDLAVLCAVYNARPEDVARFAIHQAARGVRALQAARQRQGRRTV
ncbi:winged helix-turn-helix domain-containing protein [Streptomyces sp. R39]|uniref:Winged helix-turn-helix domain-containing protein n=1 Tax=Streptomyces sp. R39 TaxID=3238631 RepID=A0AB39QLM7_9ACTN